MKIHRDQETKYPFEQLAHQVAGDVHADPIRRYLLSTDASIFKQLPAAVVYPKSTDDVRAVVRFASQHGLSLHPRGAGSGLCGSAVGSGIVLDFSKYMHRLLHLNTEQGWFECEPGLRKGELDAHLIDHGLFFPPDPSSGEYATLGGMCNTNASGAHSVKYGNVADYVLDAEVVFSDGTVTALSQLADIPMDELPIPLQELARLYLGQADTIETAYPSMACNVAGYNLRGLVKEHRLHMQRLLAGSEGTLAVMTRLKFRLIPKPAADALVVAYCDDILSAAKAVQMTLPMGPAGIEVMDKSLLRLARASDDTLRDRIPADVDNVLLIEFDGPSTQACARLAQRTQRLLEEHGLARHIYPAASTQEKDRFWAVRKAAVPILYKLKGQKKILALVEDAAVPVDQLVDYFKGIYAIFEQHDVAFVLYGHIAKGLMHTRPLLDLKDSHDVRLLQILADEVYALVDGLGGTVSGEHGDGRLRSAYLSRTYPRIYPLFLHTKALLDPSGMLNPGIKRADDPAQMTKSLRYGTSYATSAMDSSALVWPEPLSSEAEKCHGCSKCTTVTVATRMCPVYKSTRDETAAPKAKANVLRGIISGAVSGETLSSSALQRVMAQCIQCGSCYSECPSHVNIPKLAMEAKAQFVAHHGASWSDRITTHVESAARMTHRFADVIGPVMRFPSVAKLAARMMGIAPQRGMIRFTRRSLYQQVPQLTPGGHLSVLFFVGCYAGYIRPEIGRAALQVLSRMGMTIHVPPQFCCGMPQLAKGMIPSARHKVRRNLDAWSELLNRVDRVVVTCSSCGLALLREWSDVLPGHPGIQQVAQKMVHISRLVNQHRTSLDRVHPPLRLAYHQPCHLNVQPHGGSSRELLAAISGARAVEMDGRCCGMAGSWGLLAENYELSKAIGAPMVQSLNASGAQYAVTDCPTCEMQMAHMSALPVRHPIEIVHMGLSH